MAPQLLIVEDEKNARVALVRALEGDHVDVVAAASAEEGLTRFQPGRTALVLTDLKLPGMDGLALMRELRRRDPAIAVIVMTAFGKIELAVEAMRLGAYDFIEKPLDLKRVRAAVAGALEDQARRGGPTRAVGSDADDFEGIIGRSAPMLAVYEMIERVAPTRANVLVTGENGTGKELVARAIHRRSPRAAGPLVDVNLAASSPTLIEDELFGHEPGAFTDARARKIGVFERAHGGTLFVDEVGEIPPEIQVKLLRVLQEKKFERVGGTTKIETDARLVFATNKDLQAAVERGAFRDDLYYRINVVRIDLPPLRARPGDIPLLVAHFVRTLARENDREIEGVSPAAMALLERYAWPGNVRQLENCIENAVVMARERILPEELFPLDVRKPPLSADPAALNVPLGTSLPEVERELILRTLDFVGGNKTQAARVLGISPRTLYRKLDEYGKG